MYVEFTGIGLTEILGIKLMKDPAQVYKKVKSEYNKNVNLVWIKTDIMKIAIPSTGETFNSSVDNRLGHAKKLIFSIPTPVNIK